MLILLLLSVSPLTLGPIVAASATARQLGMGSDDAPVDADYYIIKDFYPGDLIVSRRPYPHFSAAPARELDAVRS